MQYREPGGPLSDTLPIRGEWLVRFLEEHGAAQHAPHHPLSVAALYRHHGRRRLIWACMTAITTADIPTRLSVARINPIAANGTYFENVYDQTRNEQWSERLLREFFGERFAGFDPDVAREIITALPPNTIQRVLKAITGKPGPGYVVKQMRFAPCRADFDPITPALNAKWREHVRKLVREVGPEVTRQAVDESFAELPEHQRDQANRLVAGRATYGDMAESPLLRALFVERAAAIRDGTRRVDRTEAHECAPDESEHAQA